MDNTPLRVRPGVALVILQWLLTYVLPALTPNMEWFEVPTGLIGMVGGLLCGLGILVWWLAFSRARWFERVGALALIVAAGMLFVHLIVPAEAEAAGQAGGTVTTIR